MIAAHVRSLTLLGIPFRSSTNQPFAFASQTITDEIRSLIPVMLLHRLTPPPQETYSLNRYVEIIDLFKLCAQLIFEQEAVGSFLALRKVRGRRRLPCYLGAGCWGVQSWHVIHAYTCIILSGIITELEYLRVFA